MEPINYFSQLNMPDLTQAYGQGLKVGAMQDALQQQYIDRQRAEQRQQQYAMDVQAAAQSRSPQAFAQLALKYPEQREAFKQSWDTLSKDQQDSDFRAAAEAVNAFNAGRPEIAQQRLDEQIKAAENSGQDSSNLRMIRDAFGQNKDFVMGALGTALYHIDPERADKMLKGQEQIQMMPSNIRKGRAEALKAQIEAQNLPTKLELDNTLTRMQSQNLQSQITERADRLNLDRDRLMSETQMKLQELYSNATKLGDDGKKVINDAVVNATTSTEMAGQMNDLANRVDALGSGGWGRFANVAEWWANATGSQDAWTQMRQDYIRIRNSAAMKSLPPGPATDKDIEMVLRPFPSETADTKTIASFLRGMAKMQQRNAVLDNAKAEWVAAVGHLGKPKTDIEIDGVSVPAGMTFADFTKMYVKRKLEKQQAEQAQQQLPQRSYMRHAAQQQGTAQGVAQQPNWALDMNIGGQ